MASRMERYYQNNTESNTRTARNSNLYDEIYDNVQYSNVEGIAKIEKTNEIDISRIKEFIKEHESQKNNSEKIIKRVVVDVPASTPQEETMQYDLKQIIETAKKERPKEEKERYVHNIKYTVITDKLKESDDIEYKSDTLMNTALLSQLGDSELSLELLDSLKGEDSDFEQEETTKEDDKSEIDSSFYTSSMKFSREDFDELDNINKGIKKNNIWITLLVFIILVIVITSCLFLFQNIL